MMKKISIKDVEEEVTKFAIAQRILDDWNPTEGEKKLVELIEKYLEKEDV